MSFLSFFLQSIRIW